MRHVRGGGLFALALALAAGGCKSDPVCTGASCDGGDTTPDQSAQSFESDLPNDSQSSAFGPGARQASADGASETAAPTAGRPGDANTASKGGDAERAITEADIIQLQGNRLYALSRVAGLAVIDVSDPGALKLLGRYRELPAEPFEMYLRDGVALVMFTGWGQYAVAEDGTASWVTTSKLLALDIADPANISRVGSFDLPGSISDSRIVGDVLYVVGHEDGYCWRCEQDKPRTSIVSLDVHDPKQVDKVDELYYDDENSSWGPRSVTVTSERMYVAGPEYGQDMPTGSTIQVVDISDAGGDLVEGTRVQVEGQVNNRWQMDEYKGVLRVVSQSPQWWTEQGVTTSKPAVETFKIESSQKLSELGRTDIELPPRDTLRSVRFDGERGYAITAEQQDPLFTLDLSDPAAPKQVGELKIPGFVYHMEPRGDRLLGLGFDQGNEKGGITVSLFDVKDLANPTELSRVNFGGTWGYLPEDQDRIHKVFRVLDDAGLILVPFAGWSDRSIDKADCYASEYVGGVQIIDYQNDTLQGRGATPSQGQTRRALLVQDALLSVGDERVESFDISDRDKPELLSQVVLARYVYRALQLDGDVVARLSSDQRGTSVDFVASSAASDPNQSYAELNLAQAAGQMSDNVCEQSFSMDETFVHGSVIEVVYTHWAWDRDTGKDQSTRGILILDASDPKDPKVVSNTTWDNGGGWSPYYSFYSYGYYGNSSPVVRTEHALAMLESSWEETRSDVSVSSTQKVRLRIVDLRDAKDVSTSVFPFDAEASYSGLLADGDIVMTSHFKTSSEDKRRGRFYIDRFDISDPSSPKQLADINVPGALMQYDSASARAITTEQVRVEVQDEISAEDCYDRFAHAEWNTDQAQDAGVGVAVDPPPMIAAATPAADGGTDSAAADAKPVEPVDPPEPVLGTCTGYRQRLNLVHLTNGSAQLEDSLELDEDKQLFSTSMGDGVLFASVGRGGYYYPRFAAVDVACFGPCGPVGSPEPAELLVLGGFDQGEFEIGHLTVEQADQSGWYGFWGAPPTYAYGKRALLLGQSDIAIIDASTASAPTIDKRVPLIAPAQYVDMGQDTALLTLGTQGVQWLDLRD